MIKKNKLIILIFGFLGIIMAANYAWAADFGFSAVGNGLGGSLAATDPRFMIGRVIQIILGFLGVIAVILVMYAGFLWMSSGGDEEKISRAKGILRSAIIGLIIVLSAWGIATYVLTRLADAIGGNGTPGLFASRNPGLTVQGTGAIGACTIETTYPAPGQADVPRNTSIMITFKEELKNESLCVNPAGDNCACNKTDCNRMNPETIRIYKTDLGDACSGATCPATNANVTEAALYLSSDNKTLVLSPLSPLGSPTGNTQYSVKLTDQVKKADDASMFRDCSDNFASWDFTVNNKLDLVPPLVVPGGIFPLPDNEKDASVVVTTARAATARIVVNQCPGIYQAARLISVNPVGESPAGASVVLDYHGPLSGFRVVVPAGSPDKAQLFDNKNNPLGVADFSSAGEAKFKDYLNFTSATHSEGNAWDILISPERLADTVTLGDTVYTFAATGENNNIQVPPVCDREQMARKIATKLNGPDIEVWGVLFPALVNLKSKIAGTSGNNIVLRTTDSVALAISPFAGGVDFSRVSTTKDKQDRPMNSAVQINFNEPIDPITVSGSTDEVAKYIKIVNAAESSRAAGAACLADSDCLSYKCESNSCVGNYLNGKFTVSNAYRTVEFVSDRECGQNGCGEKIYCLPANSHLAVQLSAANLRPCTTNNDCLAYSPYSSCRPAALGNTCQDTDARNYPAADPAKLDGIVDAAINSFDGNRDTAADGPVNFYDDNFAPTAAENADKHDKYRWSFYIGDQIKLDPPQITAVAPGQGESGTSLADPLRVSFNTLMLNSTLRSGSVAVNNGQTVTEHRLLSLRGASPVGYWITNENIDSAPKDGEPDRTVTTIGHSPFSQSLVYKAQVGSGVKDIYQNCFKPSAGPDCLATPEAPSCCFGVPTAGLDAEGNCR